MKTKLLSTTCIVIGDIIISTEAILDYFKANWREWLSYSNNTEELIDIANDTESEKITIHYTMPASSCHTCNQEGEYVGACVHEWSEEIEYKFRTLHYSERF